MSEDSAATGFREQIAGLPINWRAAKQATVLAVVAVAVLYALQMGVTAAVTSGGQPMASVGEVPVEPQSSTWEEAPSQTVELNKQQMAVPYGGGSTDELQVSALTNDSHVAFRMEWADPTHDSNIASPENYSDAAAVMFGTGEIPPIMMGGVGKPVNIWYWRASWQENTSSYGSGGMYGYPNDLAGGPTKPAQVAGNPLSTAPDRQAQNLYAEGFGSTSNAQSQPVQAEAERTEDGWSVTFVRERGIGDKYDAAFSQDEDIYVAFAVWNGSADERNGQKSITLQYQKLNPESGALSEADQSGSNGGDGNGGGSDNGDDSGGPTAADLNGWLAILVGSVVMVWMISYWRLSKQ